VTLHVLDPGRSVLAWAAEHNRILLTHDRATMPNFAYARMVAGQSMPGVFVVSDRLPVRQAIDELLLVDACFEQTEWAGLVFRTFAHTGK